eukprot:scaffold86361_cov60-Attheya_sp.AAC.4
MSLISSAPRLSQNRDFRNRMPAAPVANAIAMSDPLAGAVEVLPDRLYYIALKAHPRQDNTTTLTSGKTRHIHYFCVDTELVYWNFFLDFGPLNLGQLNRFCTKLNEKLSSTDASLSSKVICFYSSASPTKRTNAIFLITAWQVLFLDRTPEEAYNGFRSEDDGNAPSASCSLPPRIVKSAPRSSIMSIQPTPPFHDASPCECTYDLSILDCLRGLVKARMYRFFDFDDFDVDEYEYFEQVENGDLNWIIKDKILAFAGPHYQREVSPEGYCTLAPSDYIPYFRRKKVGLVVRLNKKCYDEKEFVNAGINHFEQYYLDGSCPPIKVLQRIVGVFERVQPDKGFAVHCKAGLGRTGTCIGAYIMKHYRFTAAEAIGWMRICRPGMVIGPQQQFLQDLEQRLWHEGDITRLSPSDSRPLSSRHLEGGGKETRGFEKRMTPTAVRPFGSLLVADTKSQKSAASGWVGQAESLLERRSKQQHLAHDQKQHLAEALAGK